MYVSSPRLKPARWMDTEAIAELFGTHRPNGLQAAGGGRPTAQSRCDVGHACDL